MKRIEHNKSPEKTVTKTNKPVAAKTSQSPKRGAERAVPASPAKSAKSEAVVQTIITPKAKKPVSAKSEKAPELKKTTNRAAGVSKPHEKAVTKIAASASKNTKTNAAKSSKTEIIALKKQTKVVKTAKAQTKSPSAKAPEKTTIAVKPPTKKAVRQAVTSNTKKKAAAPSLNVLPPKPETARVKAEKVKKIIQPATPKAESAAAVKKDSTAKKFVKAAEKTAPKIAETKPKKLVSPKTSKTEKRIKIVENKSVKKAEPEVEIVIAPAVPKPLKKKIKPIGSAVVRGKSGRYDFEVFPLDAEIKDGSAIYVISKRITDKSGRGHHKFVCIGQSESLIGDLKKHKKDKCIKKHNANVVCLLREENENNRLRIETDLRAAHTIFCNQK